MPSILQNAYAVINDMPEKNSILGKEKSPPIPIVQGRVNLIKTPIIIAPLQTLTIDSFVM